MNVPKLLRPIRLRLSEVMIAIVAITAIVGAWVGTLTQIRYERDEAIQAAVSQNINRVIAFEQYVARTLEGANVAMQYVEARVREGEMRGDPVHPALIEDRISDNPTFLGISRTDAAGNIIATSEPRARYALNVATHPAFRYHRDHPSDRMIVSPPGYSRVFRATSVLLTRRLNNADGSFAGVVGVNMPPAALVGLFESAHIRESDVISVIGLDGITRARRTGPRISSGEDLRGKLVMRMQRSNPDVTYLGPSGLDGSVHYFSHRRLPRYDLFVTYGILESQVLQGPRSRARLFIFGASVVTLLVLALTWLYANALARRERSAAAMAEAKQRLENAQMIGKIGDWAYDVRTDTVRWSPPLRMMYERDPAGPDPSVLEYFGYLDEESITKLSESVTQAERTGSPQEYELHVRLPSGAERYRQIYSIADFDAEGNFIGVHGTDQDITAERMLERLQHELAHVARIDAMNAMASTLAHELNQPLMAASGYLAGARRFLSNGGATELGIEGVTLAEGQVQLAGDIIRRVREMVSGQPKPNEQVSIEQAIDDAATLVLSGEEGAVIRLRKTLAPDARQIFGDRIQIQQVLINLMRNAVEALIGTEKPEIRVTSRREPNGVIEITVDDNGAGFTQPADSRFRPVESTKPGGLGLGLSISRTIVEAHGGKIWFEEKEGAGARVRFTLADSPDRG